MKELIYAIGDIHGDYLTFQELLIDYEPSLHQLVLIGDLNDRGPLSKECLLLGKQLVEESGAIYLKGNHEDILLAFLKDPENRYELYIHNGGTETLNSLIHPGAVGEYSPTEMAILIRTYHQDLIDFLEGLPLYFEWHNYLFVHAGVDLSKKNWRETSDSDFVWIRTPFHQGLNNTGKTIVFGHTITPFLHGDNQTTALWFADSKIGIDGGGIYGGSVHGVVFSQTGIVQDIEIQNFIGSWQPDF